MSEAAADLPQDHVLAQEHLAREMRAYGRESALACAVFALIGITALLALLLGKFHLEIVPQSDKSPTFAIVNDGGRTRIASALRPTDLTSPLVLASAAALGACVIVFGGAMLHLRKLPPASAWTLGLSAVASFSGLAFLLLALWPGGG